ncbi:oxidoreductase C-terminal domain-containing protein [Celeribacter sp. SCSIO 80788]|uniref:oxidoreductase C-terminal domain-containing protein n=1 Tax=Celeribacter sp. SCSIO 80788 TaxID=3117013 RepID=UPI003DA60938
MQDVGRTVKSVYHLRDGGLVAVETLNSASEHMLARQMIAAGFIPRAGFDAAGRCPSTQVRLSRTALAWVRAWGGWTVVVAASQRIGSPTRCSRQAICSALVFRPGG